MDQRLDIQESGRPGRHYNKTTGGQQWKLSLRSMWQGAQSANKTIMQCNQPLLQPIGPEERLLPFVKMSVDFVVKLSLSKGNDLILTVTDQGCTKVVILVPCREDMGAKAITDLFKEWIFPYIGIQTKLISNRDIHFTSFWFKELCRALGVDQNMSTTYHPQTDGQSERTNQTMKGLLWIFCNHQADDWAEWLVVVQYIINSHPSSTTKRVLYELWMRHNPWVHQAVEDLKVPNLAIRQKNKRGSCAGHAACTGVMGQTHQLQTI